MFTNVFNIMDTNSIITNTKIINITNKATFFKLSVDQSLEIFPKHNGLVTMLESFALNLIKSVSFTNQITICSIVMQAQTKCCIIFSKINRIHFF